MNSLTRFADNDTVTPTGACSQAENRAPHYIRSHASRQVASTQQTWYVHTDKKLCPHNGDLNNAIYIGMTTYIHKTDKIHPHNRHPHKTQVTATQQPTNTTYTHPTDFTFTQKTNCIHTK